MRTNAPSSWAKGSCTLGHASRITGVIPASVAMAPASAEKGPRTAARYQSPANSALRLPYVAMRKTSVYLPDETKEALRQVSRRWNRSEAQLIREAIDRLVRSATTESAPPSSPAPPRADGPQLIGVGVGPSAPDLITRRAVDVLERADRVFAASTAPDAISRAETIVRSAAPDRGRGPAPLRGHRAP